MARTAASSIWFVSVVEALVEPLEQLRLAFDETIRPDAVGGVEYGARFGRAVAELGRQLFGREPDRFLKRLATNHYGFVKAIDRIVEADDQMFAAVAQSVGQSAPARLDAIDQRLRAVAELALNRMPCLGNLGDDVLALGADRQDRVVEAFDDGFAMFVHGADDRAAARLDVCRPALARGPPIPAPRFG